MENRLFIASSYKGREEARALREALVARNLDARGWWEEGRFPQTRTYIESLEEILNEHQWGVFLFRSDEKIDLRGEESAAVRGNVLFEAGLFQGRKGRWRMLAVIDAGKEKDLRISDLSGVKFFKYQPGTPPDFSRAAREIHRHVSAEPDDQERTEFVRRLRDVLALGQRVGVGGEAIGSVHQQLLERNELGAQILREKQELTKASLKEFRGEKWFSQLAQLPDREGLPIFAADLVQFLEHVCDAICIWDDRVKRPDSRVSGFPDAYRAARNELIRVIKRSFPAANAVLADFTWEGLL